LGAARLAAMGAVTLTLIGFFAFIAIRASQPDMVTLYSGLALSDAAAVTKSLESQNIAYETNAEGTTIRVARSQAAAARMHLAANNLPAGTGVGWEIFDKSNGLSATSFLQNIDRLRAIEGELARSIQTINKVVAARVHLVMPQRALFQRNEQKPSASIVLRVMGELSTGQIRAIRHLVASAVEGLEPQRISVVDESGRLLADGAGDAEDIMGGALSERERAYEKHLTGDVQALLDRVVGPGRARAEVHAEFAQSHITTVANKFDPDGRVARSTQTNEETNKTAATSGGVSVGNQLPDAAAAEAKPAAKDERHTTAETTNYEISHTTTTEVKAGPRLTNVSVAVLVDGVYSQGPKGVTYAPRSQQELDQIAALVRTAVGYNQKRGDQVKVVNLRFAEPPGQPLPLDDGAGGLLGLSKHDLLRLADTGVLAIIALLVLFVVVRPLVRRVLSPEQPALLPPGAMPALPAPDGTSDQMAPSLSAGARMIEMSQVDGLVQAQALQKVGEIAQANPREAVGVIRQWLNEPAA
jgi:flagellar M-ring protein FliF